VILSKASQLSKSACQKYETPMQKVKKSIEEQRRNKGKNKFLKDLLLEKYFFKKKYLIEKLNEKKGKELGSCGHC
jgi:hypothetical protein